MIKKAENYEISLKENMRGGDGTVKITGLLTKEELNEKGRLFGVIRLEPGCSIGYHEHHGNTETYHILQGEALYSDNGKEMKIGVGTTTFCPDGEGHSIENCGTEDLVFIALITKSL